MSTEKLIKFIIYYFKYEKGALQIKCITTASIIIIIINNYCGFINSSQHVAYLNINKRPDIYKTDDLTEIMKIQSNIEKYYISMIAQQHANY